MAIATPGWTATGTRETPLGIPITPGSVVMLGTRFAVVWRRAPQSAWLAFPVRLQTGPLHRSHVKLSTDEAGALFGGYRGRMIVMTGDPEPIDDDTPCVGRIDGATFDRMVRAISRSAMSDSIETRGYARP